MVSRDINRYSHSKETFERCHTLIVDHNVWVTKMLSTVVVVAVTVFAILSAAGVNRQFLPIYVVTAVLFMVPCLASRRPELAVRYEAPLVFITSVGLFVFGVCASVADTEVVATVFHVFMFVVAILYISTMARMALLLMLGAAALVVTSYLFKDPRLAGGDLYNCVIFLLVSMAFHYQMQHERISNYQNLLDLHAAQKALAIESYFDGLSGLYNRTRFFSVAEQIELTPDHTMCLLDIDDFKHVNDTYGHSVGDHAIERMGFAIRTALGLAGKSDPKACEEQVVGRQTFAGRLGGDEFIMLIGPDGPDAASAAAEVQRIMRETDFGQLKGVGVSVGLASVREHPEASVDDLYRAADANMYREKQVHHAMREGSTR